MSSLLILVSSCLWLATAQARPQVGGSLNGYTPLVPLQFSLSSGQSLVYTTPGVAQGSVTPTITSPVSTPTNPAANAAQTSLTGTALSAEISAENAAFASVVHAAYPSLTGSAFSAFITGDSFPSAAVSDGLLDDGAAEPTLSGTAAAAESAFIASEISALNAEATGAPGADNTTDACGPKIPDPSVQDSCSTPVQQVNAPAAYGVQCLNDTQSATPVNITSCSYLIPTLCANQWQAPGNWVWVTENDCSVGSFLPPQDPPGAAPWPAQDQCEELVYASMVEDCEYAGLPWNIAAVNLKVLPDNTTTGQAVNAGYASYVVAARQLHS